MMVRIATALLLATTVLTRAAETTAYRAIVADHASGKITVVDALHGKVIANYGVEGPARLKANADGRNIYLIQGAQNRVDVIDSGLSVIRHGDHVDISVTSPRQRDGAIRGTTPSHVNFGDGEVAVFFDGDGQALVVKEEKIARPSVQPVVLRTSVPHHGLAAPVKGGFAMSIPHPTDSKQLPIGVSVVDKVGKEMARSEDCPRLHGEARMGPTSAFGCENGVLLVNATKQGIRFDKVNYPSEVSGSRMVRNLTGGVNVHSFLGDFGPDGMIVLDPVSKGITFIQLPARRTHFSRDVVGGEFGYVMLEDGQLLKIDNLTGKISGSIAVTERYSMEGGSAFARPRVSASGERVAVTDPAKGVIHIVDARKMQVLHKISVPGAPFDVVLVGAHGEAH